MTVRTTLSGAPAGISASIFNARKLRGSDAREEVVKRQHRVGLTAAKVGLKLRHRAAAYRKTFTLPQSAIPNRQSAVLLDLGRVEVIAEVKLNGRDLGIPWKQPFRTLLPSALPGPVTVRTGAWVDVQ